MVSVDLHSGQIQGFFDGPVDHLTAMPVLLDYLRREAPATTSSIVSPDAGRVKVAERYSQRLGADLAFVHKRHVKGKANAVEARGVIGDVEGRRCVLIDDMIDTAGTIVAAADILLEHGATEVWAMATHGLLVGPGRRPAQELEDQPARRHQHRCRCPPRSSSTTSRCSRWRRSSPTPSTPSSRTPRVSEIFGGENQS